MNVRTKMSFFNTPQIENDKLLRLERYYLCDLTKNSTRNTFAIFFESLTLDADEVTMNKDSSSQILLTEDLQSLTTNTHEVNKYVGVGDFFDHLNKQQKDQYDQLSKRDYCRRVVIKGEGNKLRINNSAEENLFEIPNTYAWDKSAWSILLQKCNQSLMSKSTHGVLPIQTLMDHLNEVFGALQPLEEINCTCEKKRYVGGTFGV